MSLPSDADEPDLGEPYRVLDTDGSVVDGAEVPPLDDDELVSMYREMRLARRFDRQAVTLQRGGRMGTYPPLEGQEAAQVGSARALADDDVVVPSFREHAVAMLRGKPLARVLRYWMGDARGSVPPEGSNDFVPNVPVGTVVPHAVGAAWASSYRGEEGATICYFGEGATSEGDFHEGLNFAGVFDLPVVFFCNNNGWAISVPQTRQTASETIAVKARAYGFPGVRVDGMDPLATYAVTKSALERAGDADSADPRPTLIEALQHRFGAHTTADDPTRYRDEAEVERSRELDPIPRMAAFLRGRGLLDDETDDAIGAEVDERVEEAVEAAEATPPPDPDDLFEFVYDRLPAHLEAQRDEFLAFLERHPEYRDSEQRDPEG